jgi:hypothetical protein
MSNIKGWQCSFYTSQRAAAFCPNALMTLPNYHQPPPNPLRHLRNNGISGTESLRKVGRIQSEAKPIIFRRSLPLNHLIPSVRVSDESGTAHSDLGPGFVCQ